MRAERTTLAAVAAVVVTVAFVGTGCSAEREPVRVGVLLECTGLPQSEWAAARTSPPAASTAETYSPWLR
jgi:hypothetical protein